MHLYDFSCVGCRQRTAVYGEIVCIYEYLASVYLSVARNNSVSRNLILVHAIVGTTVHHQFVQFHKRAFVQQHVDPFTGGHFPAFMLFLYLVDASTEGSHTVTLFERGICFIHFLHYSIVSRVINVWSPVMLSPSCTRISLMRQSEVTL